MSAASPPTLASGAAAAGPLPAWQAPDACPLCGTPLRPDQDWCLRCGAAARTRLAASPNWKIPAIALAVVVALSLGVLAASLVSLAGSSSGPPPARTVVVTTTTPATPTTSTPTAPSTTPGATTPGATTPGATTAPTTRTGTSTSGAGTGGITAPGGTRGAAHPLLRRLRELGRASR